MTTATGQMIDSIGTSVTYTPQGGQATTIKVLFDNQAFTIGLSMGEVSSSQPRVFAKTSDVPNAKNGDSFTISNVGYTVQDANPDGTGGTEMILTKS